MTNKIETYLTDKIENWYKNAEIDYGVTGKVDKVECNEKTVTVYFTENGKKFSWSCDYYTDYTPEQLYNIWQDSDWEEC